MTTENNINIIDKELLLRIQTFYMDYVQSSAAIYDTKGNYAVALFSSGYCNFLNQASLKMAGKTEKEALESGKWICHEDCWATSFKSITDKKSCEIECSGGIRIFAAPIISNSIVIGSNNAGVSNPPTDKEKIEEIADRYHVDPDELLKISKEYMPREDYILNIVRNHILIAAELIDISYQSIIEKRKLQKNLNELERFHKLSVGREIKMIELKKRIEELEMNLIET